MWHQMYVIYKKKYLKNEVRYAGRARNIHNFKSSVQ